MQQLRGIVGYAGGRLQELFHEHLEKERALKKGSEESKRFKCSIPISQLLPPGAVSDYRRDLAIVLLFAQATNACGFLAFESSRDATLPCANLYVAPGPQLCIETNNKDLLVEKLPDITAKARNLAAKRDLNLDGEDRGRGSRSKS